MKLQGLHQHALGAEGNTPCQVIVPSTNAKL